MDEKLLLLINPLAGKKKVLNKIDEIVNIFNNQGYDVTIYKTKAVGDGEQYILDNAKDYGIVCCAGGDGTFNETISGVVKSKEDIKVGYIPCGSTNDFASSLGLSDDIVESAKRIAKGDVKEIDVGSFSGRIFTYVATCGAFTDASYSAPQGLKNVVGHFAYILEGIKRVKNIKSFRLKISYKDTIIDDNFIFASISNSTSLAGIFKLDKDKVNVSDGLFELVLVKKPKNIIELRNIFKILRTQKFDNNNLVTFVSEDRFKVETFDEINWSIDGEFQKNIPQIEIVNLHNTIKLLI